MLDFLVISTRSPKNGLTEIYPRFRLYPKSKDLMVRGGDFYAIWVEELGLWSTDEGDASYLIDRALDKYADENRDKFGGNVKVLHMWDSDSGAIDSWHRYCQKQMRDSFRMLDEKLVFANTEINKKDYASKRLDYPLDAGSIEAYDKLISTLYSEEERHKIEWAIGAIVSGDSKHIQKFMVLYGAAGTGKSTILNIIQQLFEGYYSVFDAKALGSNSNSFALEAFKTNPLVAIQHDGDLSKIEDNTRLNSLVSHELMTVNEKFKSAYANRFKCFLFMGTNKPVKITDGKSGLLRRLIDVHPSGNKLNPREYRTITDRINFELGAIANYCLDVYLSDPGYYDDYIPTEMMGASNDFYNFVIDSYSVFKREDETTAKAAWEMYKNYCEEAKVPYPFSQRTFKEELKNYFWEYEETFDLDDGSKVRGYYNRFRTDKFETKKKGKKDDKDTVKGHWLVFETDRSILDGHCASYCAQYASNGGTPIKAWDEVTTKLSDINTSKLHYVKIPENHIVIDFDIRNETGEKSYEKNLEAASKFPPTYSELSKSGGGIHLHYIYGGDISTLSRVYSDEIEIKVFTGKSSLRRMLTKCNDLSIATISSGLPLKGEKKMLSGEVLKSEKGLRTQIIRNLNKEIHPGTKSSIDFMYKILDDAYTNGLEYDISDMKNEVIAFAASSTNQAVYCLKRVNDMKFKSESTSTPINGAGPLVFYDVEVFPNLFLVNYKVAGEGNPVVRMINPTPSDMEALIRFKLVGFNCRRYDNHMIYARLMGYTNEQLYNLSQKIINSKKGENRNCFFSEAYNLSYTDVYDFASAGNKKGLKKFEIELGLRHHELGLPWDQPVPEERWIEVAEYCDDDVIATEVVFYHLSADWTARQILADLAGMTVNDTTNTLTTRIIFKNERKPQGEFNWRDLSKPVTHLDTEMFNFLKEACPEMMAEKHSGELPFDHDSLIPYFPSYEYTYGKSTYLGEEVGEGGYVYAEPGMYGNVALLDIVSMHPTSAIMEVLFGVRFTKAFKEIVDGRVSIKHEAWAEVNQMLDGKLKPYIQKVLDGEMTSKQLADALKTAINSVYGLTSANFDNPFRDIRNKDNIVAKRGALFMIDLKHAVQKKGFTVAHIKTDSIKIPDSTPQIIQFVKEFGKRYGYTFEHEATYDRMCLVNDAVYIARYEDGKNAGEWTATGTQFAVPYVFKKLFTKESIEFEDMCETKSVSTALYLDINENLPDVSGYEKELANLEKEFKKNPVNIELYNEEEAYLHERIAEGHDYRFVGKVGNFCPIKPKCGGGLLMREKDGKYGAASGSKGYRWLESEMVKNTNENVIDRSYYDELVNNAVETIAKHGDFEWFVSDDPSFCVESPISSPKLDWSFVNIPEDISEDEVPF